MLLDLPPHVRSFLRSHRRLALGTVDDGGRPHGADVWYAADERGRLVFVSSPNSAHGQHIARDGHVAATISADETEPARIHGVQIHGTCAALIDPAERQRARSLYTGVYPFTAQPPYSDRLDVETFYMIMPTWLRWIDNRVRFGFKQEWGSA